MTSRFDLSPSQKAPKNQARPRLTSRGAAVRGVLSEVSAIYSEGDDETQIAATLTAHFADADMPISSQTVAAFAAAISHGPQVKEQARSPFRQPRRRRSTGLRVAAANDEFRLGVSSDLLDSSGGRADGGDGEESNHEPGEHLLELHGDD